MEGERETDKEGDGELGGGLQKNGMSSKKNDVICNCYLISL